MVANATMCWTEHEGKRYRQTGRLDFDVASKRDRLLLEANVSHSIVLPEWPSLVPISYVSRNNTTINQTCGRGQH
jgi:hypothetical protein